MNIDNPKKPVKIIEWISKTQKKEYIINNIYQDDIINIAIQKIINYLNGYNIYLWDTDIIEFDALLPHINPFEVDLNSVYVKKLFYKSKTGIFLRTELNIVKLENLKKYDDSLSKLYFGYKRTNLNINDDSLNNLLECESSIISEVIISKYNLESIIDLKNSSLKYYYENLDLTKNKISGLIWIYDDYNKHYNILKNENYYRNLEYFNNKVYNIESFIIFNKLKKNKKSNYFVEINKLGVTRVNLYLENSSKYTISDIINIRENISDLLQSIFTTNIEFTENSIKAKININVPNFSKDKFNKQISKICGFITQNNDFYIYNKTSLNDNISFDIEDFIKDLLYTNHTEAEIITIILFSLSKGNNNLDKKDISDLIKDILRNEENVLTKTKKIYIVNKTFFKIQIVDKHRITINIENVPSIIELSYIIFWLSKISLKASDTTKIEFQKKSVSPIDDTKVSVEEDDDSLGDLSSPDDSLGDLSPNSLLEGGMPKRKNSEKQIKQINYLRGLDPELFNDKSDLNYAKACQSNRQPLGMESDKFKQYEKSVDNHLVIKKNTYFCPRYWCPISEKPILTKNEGCDDNEVPIDLYHGLTFNLNDPDRPKYVNYITENYLKPCCYLKEKKISIIDEIKKDSINLGENNYILTTFETIPNDRFGILPKPILNFIDNNSGLPCTSQLKNKKCAYRMGIANNKRDLIDILVLTLGFNNRYSLIKQIYNKLDFVSFISLENGEVARDFLKKSYYSNKKRTHDKIFSKNYNINIDIQYRKNIDYALTAFIDYLKNDKVDNPHYLYCIISLLEKTNIYIWKYKNEKCHIICPLYVSYKQLNNLADSDDAVFIFYNNKNDIFEPIVGKSKTDINYIFNTSKLKLIKKLTSLCDEKKVNDDDILNNLNEYVKYFSLYNKEYLIDKILLNSNLTVNTLILKNKKILRLNKCINSISFHKVIDITNCKNIYLYDEYNYILKQKDDTVILNKIEKLNFSIVYNLENQYFSNSIIFYNTQKLHDESKLNNELYAIVDYIYTNKDYTIFNDWKDSIIKYFKNDKNILKVHIFLEEIENINYDINKWYNNYNFNKYFLNENIIHTNERSIFNNKALHIYNNIFKTEIESVIIKYENPIITTSIINPQIYTINFTNTINSIIHKLPSKWNSYNLKYIETSNYTNNDLYELFKKINKTDKNNIIKELRNNKIKILLGSDNGINYLLNLINYKDIICNELNLQNTSPFINIINKFNKFTTLDKENFITNIIDLLNTSQIDVYAASEIINVAFIVIHSRSFQLKQSIKVVVKRNSIQDIIGTCDVFINKIVVKEFDEYPLILLYSDGDRLYFIDNGYYANINDAPDDIKQIIQYKLKSYKEEK